MFGHRARAAAQHGVGRGAAIGGHDDDGIVGTQCCVRRSDRLPTTASNSRGSMWVGSSVRQSRRNQFSFSSTCRIVMAAGAEGRGDRFLAVRMVEKERAGVAIGHGGFQRVGRKRGEQRAGEGEKPGAFADGDCACAESLSGAETEAGQSQARSHVFPLTLSCRACGRKQGGKGNEISDEIRDGGDFRV